MNPSTSTPRVGPPLLFTLARGMVRRGVPGGYRIIEWLERNGMLNTLARYRLSERVSIQIPLWRRPNQLNLTEACNYERPLIDFVARQIEAFAAPTTLIDCGADVGLISALLMARTDRIDDVYACEPNREAFAILEKNQREWPVRTTLIPKAIADFVGTGAMEQPEYDSSPHAAFLAEGTVEVDVTTIDALQIDVAERCLVLKIDVEGGEAAVIRGALQTIARAEKWIVTIEAHRLVTERTGVDPFEVVRLLPSDQLARVFLAERPERQLDRTRPYFSQVTNVPIGNLVCVSQ